MEILFSILVKFLIRAGQGAFRADNCVLEFGIDSGRILSQLISFKTVPFHVLATAANCGWRSPWMFSTPVENRACAVGGTGVGRGEADCVPILLCIFWPLLRRGASAGRSADSGCRDT